MLFYSFPYLINETVCILSYMNIQGDVGVIKALFLTLSVLPTVWGGEMCLIHANHLSL